MASTSTILELDCGAVLDDRGLMTFLHEIPASALSSEDIFSVIPLLSSPDELDPETREHTTEILAANTRARYESDFRPGEQELLRDWFASVGTELRFRQERSAA